MERRALSDYTAANAAEERAIEHAWACVAHAQQGEPVDAWREAVIALDLRNQARALRAEARAL